MVIRNLVLPVLLLGSAATHVDLKGAFSPSSPLSTEECTHASTNFLATGAGIGAGILTGVLIKKAGTICHELGHYTVGKALGLHPQAVVLFNKVVIGSVSDEYKREIQQRPFSTNCVLFPPTPSGNKYYVADKATDAAGPIMGVAVPWIAKTVMDKIASNTDSTDEKKADWHDTFKTSLLKSSSAFCSRLIYDQITLNMIPGPDGGSDGNHFFETKLSRDHYKVACFATALAIFGTEIPKTDKLHSALSFLPQGLL